MSSDTLSVVLSISETILASGLFLYSGYWGLAIRKALVAPLYRRQALWVGIVGIYFAGVYLYVAIANPFGSNNLYIFYFGGLSFFTGFVLIFAWIDGSIRVARRSDPLLRDTLHWMKLGIVIWAGIFLGIIGFVGLFVRLVITNRPISGFENVGFIAAILAILLSGSPALFISARRSKDPTLRRHLRWFELFASVLIMSSTLGYVSTVFGTHSGSPSTAEAYIGYSPFIIAAYFLYRSARSLAPLGRISLEAASSQ